MFLHGINGHGSPQPPVRKGEMLYDSQHEFAVEGLEISALRWLKVVE